MAQTVVPADQGQLLDAYIDSFAALVPSNPLPPGPPQTTYSTQQGIRFADVTATNLHSANLTEVVVSAPNSDVLWPGNVIQGKTIQSGVLAAVGLPRAPLAITLTGALGSGPVATTVQSPSLATVTTALRDLLQGLNLSKATAAVDFVSSTGSTEEDALLNVQVSANFLGQSVKASLDTNSTRKSTTVAVKFVQRYYSLGVETPPDPASLFAANTTVDSASRFIGSGNPPAYISQINYGRMLIYTFESTQDADTLKAAVDAVFNAAKFSAQISLTDEQKRIFNQASIHFFALGGSAEDALQLVAGNDFASQLSAYLKQGANFSFNEPGAPLSYYLKFVKDGTVASVNSTTQWYTTTSYAQPDQGNFTVSLGKNNNAVTRTNFFVRPGDRISISATGTVWSGVWATGWTGPNGWYTWSKPGGSNFPNGKVSPFSLLYGVGDSYPIGDRNNPPPYAGFGFASRQYTGSSGELILLINTNCPTCGAGRFDIRVSIDRQN